MISYAGRPPSAAHWANLFDRLAFASLYVFVFLMPWEEAVPMIGGFVIGRWVIVLVSLILALRIVVRPQIRKPALVLGLMLATALWAVLSTLWTIDEDLTSTRAGTFVQLLLLAWMIWELVTTDERALGLLRAYAFGASVLASSTLINYMNGVQAADLAAQKGLVRTRTFRYTVAGVNENDLGLMLALSIPITLYLLSRRRGPLMVLYCWLHMGLCLTALLLAGSRAGLISAIVGLVMFPLIMYRLPRWQRAAFIFVCAAGLLVGISLVPDVVLGRLANTQTELSEGTLTHRTVLWSAGLEAFRDHAFMGVGAGAYGAAIVNAVDIPFVAHNTFISILVEQGVIGALLWLAMLGSLFYCAVKSRYDERCLWIVLLCTWAIGVSTLTWEYHKATWLVFGLLTAHAYARRTAPEFAKARRSPFPPTSAIVPNFGEAPIMQSATYSSSRQAFPSR